MLTYSQVDSRLTVPPSLHTVVAYSVLTRIMIVAFEIVGVVLFIVIVAHVTWSYRQGSFPISSLRRNAKRGARRSRQLDREDNEHEAEGDS